MSDLLIERQDQVETWTLNRPRARNALNENLVRLLREALRSAEATGVEVVVLRGAGPGFCAGADLSLLATFDAARWQTPRDHLATIWDLTVAMEASPVVCVAALHGHAIAGGLELALACDVVLAATGTVIGDGHVRHCLIAGGGASARMERAFGRATSTWLALSGDFIAAEDPVFGSWLRAVVDLDELEGAVASVVGSLTQVPAAARVAYKRLLGETHGGLTSVDRDRELDAFDRHWLANDVPQALRAFLTKNREAS